MHYVKYFDIKGVNTKQVACIELQGVPNAATEGALGVLGIDVTSPTHDVYKCVAVNGSVYTWELLSAGMSIMSAKVSREGALSATFPYTELIFPNNYLVKSGDLILDKEGYLYRIVEIGANECTAEYCNTHIGGMASGDKDRRLNIKDGKLRLETESGAVLSEMDYLIADEKTIHRNELSGQISVIGITTTNGIPIRFFLGTQSEFDQLKDEQKRNVYAIITDDKRLGEWVQWREQINGYKIPTKAIDDCTKEGAITDPGLYTVVVGSGTLGRRGVAMLPLYELTNNFFVKLPSFQHGSTTNVITVEVNFWADKKRFTVTVLDSAGDTSVRNSYTIQHCRLITKF